MQRLRRVAPSRLATGVQRTRSATHTAVHTGPTQPVLPPTRTSIGAECALPRPRLYWGPESATPRSSPSRSMVTHSSPQSLNTATAESGRSWSQCCPALARHNPSWGTSTSANTIARLSTTIGRNSFRTRKFLPYRNPRQEESHKRDVGVSRARTGEQRAKYREGSPEDRRTDEGAFDRHSTSPITARLPVSAMSSPRTRVTPRTMSVSP